MQSPSANFGPSCSRMYGRLLSLRLGPQVVAADEQLVREAAEVAQPLQPTDEIQTRRGGPLHKGLHVGGAGLLRYRMLCPVRLEGRRVRRAGLLVAQVSGMEEDVPRGQLDPASPRGWRPPCRGTRRRA